MLHIVITTYLIVRRRLDNLLVLFAMCITVSLLFLKPDAYDILNYTKAVSYVSYFTFEPLFSVILVVLKKFFSARTTIWIVQIIIFIVTYLVVKIVLKMKIDHKLKIQYFLLMLLMPGFILGISNALRQCMAALLAVLAIYYSTKRRWILSFLLFVLGILFHFSLMFMVPLLILAKILTTYHVYGLFVQRGVRIKLSYTLIIFFLVVLFLSLFLVIPSIASFLLSTKYGYYFRTLFIEGRKPLFLKILFVATSYFGSMFFVNFKFNTLGKTICSEDRGYFIMLNNLRLIILLTSTLFVQNPFWWEAGARVLYYYYVVEMFWMIKALQIGYIYSPVWVFFVNTFAVNVWNVLNGCL